MFFSGVTYNISLQGRFELSDLHQMLKNHQYIMWKGVNHGVSEYTLETETGLARIDVFADSKQRHYADQLLFMVTISTPSPFIKDLIECFDELAELFTFSMQAYEIRMGEPYTLGWYEVSSYERLKHDYQEVHEMWKTRTGLPTFKSNQEEFSQNCMHVRVRQKQQPMSIILCPPDSDIDFYHLGGSPNYGVGPDSVNKDDFYQKIRAIQPEQCKLLRFQQRMKTIPSSHGPEEEEGVPIEVVLLEIDNVELALEIHTRADGQVGWLEYGIELGTASHLAKQILQCLVELATKLDWRIIEGLDFQKSAPADLDTRKLIEFVSGNN